MRELGLRFARCSFGDRSLRCLMMIRRILPSRLEHDSPSSPSFAHESGFRFAFNSCYGLCLLRIPILKLDILLRHNFLLYSCHPFHHASLSLRFRSFPAMRDEACIRYIAAVFVIDKVQEETKSRADRKPPVFGRGRGRGREDGPGRQPKGARYGFEDGAKGQEDEPGVAQVERPAEAEIKLL